MKILMSIFLGVAGFILIYSAINAYAVLSTASHLYSVDDTEKLKEADAILVLGAGVRGDGTPSLMLEDRLLCALQLWQEGKAGAIIVSGDHGRKEYNEVGVMKAYLVERGVPSERVFMDHAGFSTYDSLYRAKEIFGVRSLILVTQKYHSYRALMIGRHLNMDCNGVWAPILSSNASSYRGQIWYSTRESVARCKDFFYSIVKPKAKIMGDPISLEADAEVTNG